MYLAGTWLSGTWGLDMGGCGRGLSVEYSGGAERLSLCLRLASDRGLHHCCCPGRPPRLLVVRHFTDFEGVRFSLGEYFEDATFLLGLGLHARHVTSTLFHLHLALALVVSEHGVVRPVGVPQTRTVPETKWAASDKVDCLSCLICQMPGTPPI